MYGYHCIGGFTCTTDAAVVSWAYVNLMFTYFNRPCCLFVEQSVLTKADRGAISVLLNHLRNSAQDLVNIAVRFTSPTVSHCC
jgi:hypothetical protein